MPTDDTEDSIDTPDEHRQVFLGMEPADDGEGYRAVDALASVCVAFDDTDPVVVPKCR